MPTKRPPHAHTWQPHTFPTLYASEPPPNHARACMVCGRIKVRASEDDPWALKTRGVPMLDREER